jgi:hypothetical protein
MFTIDAVRIDNETLYSQVKIGLKDGTELMMEIPQFAPQSMDEVLNGIANREESEQRKYDALVKNELIKTEMEKDAVTKVFERKPDGKVSLSSASVKG